MQGGMIPRHSNNWQENDKEHANADVNMDEQTS